MFFLFMIGRYKIQLVFQLLKNTLENMRRENKRKKDEEELSRSNFED